MVQTHGMNGTWQPATDFQQNSWIISTFFSFSAQQFTHCELNFIQEMQIHCVCAHFFRPVEIQFDPVSAGVVVQLSTHINRVLSWKKINAWNNYGALGK